jgi:hypothetical protein
MSTRTTLLYNRVSKQLIYNYTTIRAWKYEQLINKMICQKIKELYYNCNLITNGTPIQSNVYIIHMDVINHAFTFWQVAFKIHVATILQLVQM